MLFRDVLAVAATQGGGGAPTPTFDPAAAFGSALKASYDVSDLSSLFQETSGSGVTPAVVDGAVGMIRDTSGNALHMYATGTVTLRKKGPAYYLEIASGARLVSAATYTMAYPHYVIAGMVRPAIGTNHSLFGAVKSATAFHRLMDTGSGYRWQGSVRDAVAAASTTIVSQYSAYTETPTVADSLAAVGVAQSVWINGVLKGSNSNSNTASVASMAIAVNASVPGTSTASVTHFYGGAVVQGVAPTDAQRASFATYWQRKMLSITISNFPDRRIIQRDVGDTSATNVAVRGTCHAALSGNIETKVTKLSDGSTVVDWATTGTASGGVWSGTIPSIPQSASGEMYKIEARAVSDPSCSVRARGSWGVGALIWTMGQSNTERLYNTDGTISADPTDCGYYTTDPVALAPLGWQDIVEGNGLRMLVRKLSDGLGVSVGVVHSAEGGTVIDLWNETTDPDAAAAIADLVAATDRAAGDCEFILWQHGETNALTPGMSKANYKTKLGEVLAWARAHTGRSAAQLPFLCGLTGRYTVGLSTDAEWDAIRQAQLEFIAEQSGNNVHFAGSPLDFDLTDGTHWTIPNYARVARRYAQAGLFAKGLAAYGGKGPTIASASRPSGSAVITLAIAHNGAGAALKEADGTTDGGSLTGFRVLVNGVAATISSTAIASATSVTLTLSSIPADGDTVAVQYQYGMNPANTKVLYDDTTPGGDTLGLPLTPTTGAVAVALA